MVFFDLKEVEEAPRLRELVVIVEDSWVGLGEVVGIILPGNFHGLQSERGKRPVAVRRGASRYLRFNVHVPAEVSLGISNTVLVLLLTIDVFQRGVPVFLLQHGVGEEWVLLEVLQRHM